MSAQYQPLSIEGDAGATSPHAHRDESFDVLTAGLFGESFDSLSSTNRSIIDEREGDTIGTITDTQPPSSSKELIVAIEKLKGACENVLSVLANTRSESSEVDTRAFHSDSPVANSLFVASTPPFQQAPFEHIAEKVVEGFFDGQHMRGGDGRQYSIPPNYASKSKLVEGDGMKVTITQNGSFIFKQIRQIERRRVMGILEQDPLTHEYVIRTADHRWRVLTASVTYYKGIPGDEAVIVIPTEGISSWGAVENIIKKY